MSSLFADNFIPGILFGVGLCLVFGRLLEVLIEAKRELRKQQNR